MDFDPDYEKLVFALALALKDQGVKLDRNRNEGDAAFFRVAAALVVHLRETGWVFGCHAPNLER